MLEERTPGLAAEVSDELQSWRIRVLNIVLIVVAVAATAVALNSVVQAVREPDLWPQTVPFLAAYLFLLSLTLLRRLDYRLRAWGMLVVGYAVGILYLAILGLLGNGMIFLLVLPALGVILLGFRSGLILMGFSLCIYVGFALAAHLGWMKDWLIITENSLDLSQWVSQGLSFALLLLGLVVIQALFARAQAQALQSARQTARELGVARDELQIRTEQLNQYARFLEATSRISSDIISLLDREDLLQRAANALVQQLDLERVAVYLVDVGATGSEQVGAGRIVLAAVAGHGPPQPQVPAVVAQVVRREVFQTAELLAEEQMYYELALPLKMGRQVIAVLDVQSTQMASFSNEQISTLQVMADQLAVALENARLYAEAQASLQELDALYHHYSVEAWHDFVRARPDRVHTRMGAQEVQDETWQTVFEQARVTGTAATAIGEKNGRHLLAVPVKLRDLPIGILGFHRSAAAGAWQSSEITAIEAVAERMAFAADNLRLLEVTQRRAARDRLVDRIASQVQGSLDPDSILKTTVRELGRMLGAKLAMVEITGPQGNGGRRPAKEDADEE